MEPPIKEKDNFPRKDTGLGWETSVGLAEDFRVGSLSHSNSTFLTSKKGTTSPQGTQWLLVSKCPLFEGSTAVLFPKEEEGWGEGRRLSRDKIACRGGSYA